MITLIVLAVTYTALVGLGLSLLWPYRRGSPTFWFQPALALMALGTLLFVQLGTEADRTYVAMFFIAQITFLTMTMLSQNALDTRAAFDRFSAQDPVQPTDHAFLVTVGLFVFSALVTVVYYYLIGYNLLFILLTSGSDVDYSTLRLEAYSGDRYFAPGYVNQFKNVLLPLTALLIAIALKRAGRNTAFNLFVLGAAPLVLVALAGTGQRAFIAFTAVAGVFGYFLDNTGRDTRGGARRIAIALVPIVALFGFMTAAYADVKPGDSVAMTVLERFTAVQQEGALFGFEYIYNLPTVWFYEWWQGLVGILPGVEGSTLSHDIYGALYGTTRGTAPLSSVGSAYYNGGLVGVILLFAAMGFLYSYVYTRFLSGPRNYFRSYAYGFMFFYLAVYVADSPTILLDNGILAIALFLVLIKGGQVVAGNDQP